MVKCERCRSWTWDQDEAAGRWGACDNEAFHESIYEACHDCGGSARIDAVLSTFGCIYGEARNE